MITHLPLMIHPNPINVLIVGGGDGGVLREVCRHSCVQEITLVEIDQMVIDVAKRFFGDSTATAFDDDRVLCINEDAAEFLKKHNEKNAKKYDVSTFSNFCGKCLFLKRMRLSQYPNHV
jgi:spermidine synthase